MRLFELLRALRSVELARRDGRAGYARARLIARQRRQLAQVQTVLYGHRGQLASEPYPLAEKLDALLGLLARVLGVDVSSEAKLEMDALGEYWSTNCAQVPFRDATPKNTIVVHPALSEVSRAEDDLSTIIRALDGSAAPFWEECSLVDVDFTSVQHLTSFEDDPISLHFHEWTNGSCAVDPGALLLMSAVATVDSYRAAASFFVRYLRFGGRKLGYRIFNSGGFEVRFRYDDPLFYFVSLRERLQRLSPAFVEDFEALIALVDCIGLSARHPSSADRSVISVDWFRRVFGYGGDYWPENPGRV